MDIKNRLFPSVPYGFGIRRKKNKKPRKSIFFTNRTNVKLRDDISSLLAVASNDFLNFESLLEELARILGEYELKFCLDVNERLNFISLLQAQHIYKSSWDILNTHSASNTFLPEQQEMICIFFWRLL